MSQQASQPRVSCTFTKEDLLQYCKDKELDLMEFVCQTAGCPYGHVGHHPTHSQRQPQGRQAEMVAEEQCAPVVKQHRGVTFADHGGAVQLTAVGMLEKVFACKAQYRDPVQPAPVGGRVWDRDGVEHEFDEHVKYLEKSPDKKARLTAEGRCHYPLAALVDRPGAGKTFLLRHLAHLKRSSHVSALISLGCGSKIDASEIARGADTAIAIRILYTLFKDVPWDKFLAHFDERTVPTIRCTIDLVRKVANRPEAPCLLLVDETAAAIGIGAEATIERGYFCTEVLASVGEVQQHAVDPVARHKQGCAPAIHAVVTSLRDDIAKASERGRPVTRLSCVPFSTETLQELRKEWAGKLVARPKYRHCSVLECERFVEALLVYSGGLPRVVVWAHERIFVDANQRETRLESYYNAPPWDVVAWCLRGQRVGTHVSAKEQALAVVRYGVRFDADGIPSLPPFQLHAWAATVTCSSKENERRAARILDSLVPLAPPESVADATNAGSQRLAFEKVTQAFVLLQHLLLAGKEASVAHYFPPGVVHNIPADARLCCEKMKRVASAVHNYPQDVPNHPDIKEAFLAGEVLVVPANPCNAAIDHGCATRVKLHPFDGFIQQDSQNKFTDGESVHDIAAKVLKRPMIALGVHEE